MLKGKRIIIRIVEKKDLENLRILRNNPQTNSYLTSNRPISQKAQEKWFEKINTDNTKIYYVIEKFNREFLGLVRLDEWDKVNRSIRVGVDVVPKFRRRGYATEAYRLLFKYLFEDLDINRLWLLVLEFNKPALSLYKKLGFKLEGRQRKAILRNGKFNDYLMMSILKEEYEKKG